MIESKATLALLYIMLVMLAVCLPYGILLFSKGSEGREKWDRVLLWCFTAVPIVFLFPNGAASKVVISIIVSIPFAYFISPARGIRLWGGVVGFAIFSTVVWWPVSAQFALWRLIPFWAIGAATLLILRQDRIPLSRNAMGLTFGFIVFLGLIAHVFTGNVSFGVGFATMWHHLGVYVATAQLIQSGAVPFADFPLQYGFGPTVFMAMACRPDCWIGAYYTVFFVNILYLASLTFGAALLMQRAPKGLALLSMVAVATAVLLWTSYPPDILGPLATPSTTGMRFLPMAALLIFIIHQEVTAQTRPVWGYAIWILSMIWSPEAAIFATMVWWPYMALVQVHKQLTRSLKSVATTAGLWVFVMVAATLLLVITFSVVFWAIFGQAPDLNGYLAYLRNPPGLLPANLGGPIWVLLAVIALAGVAMVGADESETRILAASTLATLAVATYYLGRSHDNNILNLFPFITLILISALRTKLMDGAMGFGKAILFGIVIWPSLFGTFSIKSAVSNGYAGQIGLYGILTKEEQRLMKAWTLIADSFGNAATGYVGPDYDDLLLAIQTILGYNQGTPIVINGNYTLQIESDPDFWTTMINPAAYVVLPHDEIRHYVMQARALYNKPGWVIMQHDEMLVSSEDWLEIFSSAYGIAQTRSFGDYNAYYLTPK